VRVTARKAKQELAAFTQFDPPTQMVWGGFAPSEDVAPSSIAHPEDAVPSNNVGFSEDVAPRRSARLRENTQPEQHPEPSRDAGEATGECAEEQPTENTAMPFSLQMTMKALQQFAKDHALEVQGKSKTAFYDSLCAAWKAQTPPPAEEVPDKAEVDTEPPVSMKMTRKELEKFAEDHALGPIEGKTKPVYFENLCTAWRNSLR
jgi:hypothetical protein